LLCQSGTAAFMHDFTQKARLARTVPARRTAKGESGGQMTKPLQDKRRNSIYNYMPGAENDSGQIQKQRTVMLRARHLEPPCERFSIFIMSHIYAPCSALSSHVLVLSKQEELLFALFPGFL